MQKEIFEPGGFYHVYNRGNNKEDIFIEDKNYHYFLLRLKEYILSVADVYAYCLLKNHFHLVLKLKEIEDLPEKFKTKVHLPFSHFFNAYAKSFNKAYNRTGSLFQEHLQRNKVSDEKYLTQLIIYLHLNPVKHNLSKDFRTYPYSSFRTYISEKPTNLSKDYILDLFGGKENFEISHNESQLKYENIIDEINKMDD